MNLEKINQIIADIEANKYDGLMIQALKDLRKEGIEGLIEAKTIWDDYNPKRKISYVRPSDKLREQFIEDLNKIISKSEEFSMSAEEIVVQIKILISIQKDLIENKKY